MKALLGALLVVFCLCTLEENDLSGEEEHSFKNKKETANSIEFTLWSDLSYTLEISCTCGSSSCNIYSGYTTSGELPDDATATDTYSMTDESYLGKTFLWAGNENEQCEFTVSLNRTTRTTTTTELGTYLNTISTFPQEASDYLVHCGSTSETTCEACVGTPGYSCVWVESPGSISYLIGDSTENLETQFGFQVVGTNGEKAGFCAPASWKWFSEAANIYMPEIVANPEKDFEVDGTIHRIAIDVLNGQKSFACMETGTRRILEGVIIIVVILVIVCAFTCIVVAIIVSMVCCCMCAIKKKKKNHDDSDNEMDSDMDVVEDKTTKKEQKKEGKKDDDDSSEEDLIDDDDPYGWGKLDDEKSDGDDQSDGSDSDKSEKSSDKSEEKPKSEEEKSEEDSEKSPASDSEGGDVSEDGSNSD